MALQLVDQLISFIDTSNSKELIIGKALIIGKGETIELSSNKRHEFESIVIKQDGTLTSKDGGILLIKCNNDLILEKNGSINLNYKGYKYDEGIGKGIDGGGGSYCSKGGEWEMGYSGKLYKDILDMGSGGGTWGSFQGGNGGGYIDIIIGKNGKLILNQGSNICANGGNGQDTEYVCGSGAGSGGCINIKCYSLQSLILKDKTSTISAIGGKGGAGRCYLGGDGGNGKIQINLDQTGKFDEEILRQILPTPDII